RPSQARHSASQRHGGFYDLKARELVFDDLPRPNVRASTDDAKRKSRSNHIFSSTFHPHLAHRVLHRGVAPVSTGYPQESPGAPHQPRPAFASRAAQLPYLITANKIV